MLGKANRREFLSKTLAGTAGASVAFRMEENILLGAMERDLQEFTQQGFQPLFDGQTLTGWELKPWHEGHWTARDGVINYDGITKRKRGQDPNLWTVDEYADFVLYVEWRLPAEPKIKPHPIVLYNGDFLMEEKNPRKRVTRPRLDAGDSGILMRGTMKCQANIWSQELGSGEINGYRTDRKMPQEVRRACIPIRNADNPFGQWNAFEITLKGESMTVVLNGEKVINLARLPDLPVKGSIGLQHHGDQVQFRNLWVKQLDSPSQSAASAARRSIAKQALAPAGR